MSLKSRSAARREDICARIREAKAALESVLTLLCESCDPVECVADGRLQVALFAVDETANLLGIDS